jgi:hypothetical protein
MVDLLVSNSCRMDFIFFSTEEVHCTYFNNETNKRFNNLRIFNSFGYNGFGGFSSRLPVLLLIDFLLSTKFFPICYKYYTVRKKYFSGNIQLVL